MRILRDVKVYIGIQRFKREGIMEYEMNKNVTHGSNVMDTGAFWGYIGLI